jgi:hypothetical protein
LPRAYPGNNILLFPYLYWYSRKTMKAEKRQRLILSAALEGASVRAAPVHNAGVDFVVEPSDGAEIPIQVRWAGEGWPDDVRRATAGLPSPWPTNLVVLAHRLSPGAIEWLRDRDANWADEAGQARILGPAGVIVVKEPSLPAPPRPKFQWSHSALGIAETVLARSERELRIPQLADTSGWSVPQTATVLQDFDAQGWTAKSGPARGRGAHRELVDLEGLLTAFTVAIGKQQQVVRFAHRAVQDPLTFFRSDLLPALDRHVDWALSGWGGLELVAPLVSMVPSLHIYVSEDDFVGVLATAIAEAGLREVSEGARVTFWQTDSRVLQLCERHNGTPVVSPPRLYADLSSFGARGQDAADHVKRELIDPRHRRR